MVCLLMMAKKLLFDRVTDSDIKNEVTKQQSENQRK
jgi:hypothetical protein